MSKKLTSFDAASMGDAIANGVGRLADLSVTASVTNISYVNETRITLEKVIIEKASGSFHGSSGSGSAGFVVGLCFGLACGFLLCSYASQETHSNPHKSPQNINLPPLPQLPADDAIPENQPSN